MREGLVHECDLLLRVARWKELMAFPAASQGPVPGGEREELVGFTLHLLEVGRQKLGSVQGIQGAPVAAREEAFLPLLQDRIVAGVNIPCELDW